MIRVTWIILLTLFFSQPLQAGTQCDDKAPSTNASAGCTHGDW
jgi:hypothetical protein